MASIDSKEAVDKIIAQNGSDGCIKIVQYNNMFDGRLVYGLVFKGDNRANYNRYEESAACNNPVVLWEKK